MGRANRSHIRKKELLSGCIDVIADVGFDNTTFAKLAARLDVTPALLVHYFKSKSNLFLELVDFMFEDQTAIIKSKIDGQEQPEQRLKIILDYYLSEEFHRKLDNNVFYGCFYLSLRDEEIKSRFKKIQSSMDGVILSEIERYLNSTAKTHINAEQIAFYLNSLLEGADFLNALDIDEAPREERMREIKKLIWTLFEVETPENYID